MAVNELAELLTPIGCGPLASPTPINRCTLSWGFHTVSGGIDPWDHRLGSRFIRIVESGRISDPGMGP